MIRTIVDDLLAKRVHRQDDLVAAYLAANPTKTPSDIVLCEQVSNKEGSQFIRWWVEDRKPSTDV